jgi:hypothetical protein
MLQSSGLWLHQRRSIKSAVASLLYNNNCDRYACHEAPTSEHSVLLTEDRSIDIPVIRSRG